MIFTRDFVTRENYWQIASLVTQKSVFTVTHALFFISSNEECIAGLHMTKYQHRNKFNVKNDMDGGAQQASIVE